MVVHVNGEPRELVAGTTLQELIEGLGHVAQGRGLAVALDSEVVPRSRWSSTPVAAGARIEVVVAVQGG